MMTSAKTDDIYARDYDVVIIGGGITGAGTARDCAMRGLRVLLVEQADFCHGATGRNHGLLHSGARYAVTDSESARECIGENMILRRIASHCVDETDGLFITLPEDDLAYQQTFVESCINAGIRAEVIDPALARQLEPSVNPALVGAVRVPDASVDPFRLTMANLLDARRHGATLLNYHEVESLIVRSGRVEGVKLIDKHNKRNNIEVRARVVINAAGIWGQRIAEMAGVKVSLFPSRGALLIFGHRVNGMVINRCRKPANADILVPDDAVCVIGTTSDRVPMEAIDDMRVTAAEVDLLLREGAKMAPALATTRVLRAYAGVRPLVACDDDPSGRRTSRGIVCYDHATRDGLEGFLTITGGKMMTYRLMAETVTDAACKKLGVTVACSTATTALPGSILAQTHADFKGSFGTRAAIGRHGTMASEFLSRANHTEKSLNSDDDALVCECEGVTVSEIKYAVACQHARSLVNLRQRTRLGMGTCQGNLCAARAANLMGALRGDQKQARADLMEFIDERWKGLRPVAWGDTLREAQLIDKIYQGLCGLSLAQNMQKNNSSFLTPNSSLEENEG